MTQAQAQPTPQQIADDLYTAAETAARSLGKTLRPNAGSIIRTIADRAADEVLTPKQFGNRSQQRANKSLDERLDEAREAMHDLVKEMADHGATIPNYHDSELGERTLDHAMNVSGFCPCWPIC